MPDPGQVNNPGGANSFDKFAPEPAYGEGIKQKALTDAAPLVGGKVAAGAIAAPKRAQRKAVNGQPAEARAAFAQAPEQPMMPTAPQVVSPAQTWQEIAASPGAENHPILHYYAQRA